MNIHALNFVQLTLMAAGLAGCVTAPQSMRASLPRQSLQAVAPATPKTYPEEREATVACAAGAVKRAIRTGILKSPNVLVTSIYNRTKDLSLQEQLDIELAHVSTELGFVPFVVGADNPPHLVRPSLIFSTDVSVIDRNISAAEATKEYGVNFGRGNGTGAIALPSSDKFASGAIRATTKAETMVIGADEKTPVRKIAATHSSRAQTLTRTTTTGTEFYLVVNYGNSQSTKSTEGPQRAALYAARASIAGAAMRAAGYEPAICGL